MKLLDGLLSDIKVPDLIKCPPRCLKERKHWKGIASISFRFVRFLLFRDVMCYGSIGTEWQYWLLFYSLPVLKGVLPSVYFVHYCALVCAISILLSNDISEMELVRANVLLCQFYSHVAVLYGKSSSMTMKSCIMYDAGMIIFCRCSCNFNEHPSTETSNSSCEELGTIMVILVLWF